MRNTKQILVAARKHVAKHGITGGYCPYSTGCDLDVQMCPRGLVMTYGGELNGRGPFDYPSSKAACKALEALDSAINPKLLKSFDYEEYKKGFILGRRAESQAHAITRMKPSNRKRAAVAFIDRAIAAV